MFVLGIDPGVSRCGYAVLQAGRPRPNAIAIGVLRTEPSMPLPERLAILQADLVGLFEEFQPQALAIERVLFQKNVSTAISVGQASGIAMATAAARGCEVVEYSPNEVKQAVTGNGAADKEAVGMMVKTLLGLQAVPRPADAADAAAIAICHLAMAPMRSATNSGAVGLQS